MITLALVLAVARPPGLPNYTHPTNPVEREAAASRAWKVLHAIEDATDDQELRDELWRVCRRESACNWIGVTTYHRIDARGGRARWRRAVASGALDPARCPEHEMGDPARWTSYGAFGVASAWTVRYVGDCVSPAELGDPRVAAKAAVAWVDTLCRKYDACDCESRTRWWVGPGVWSGRSERERLASIERQCGERPLWRWGLAWLLDVWSEPAREAVFL
jgi:hypothetical protein